MNGLNVHASVSLDIEFGLPVSLPNSFHVAVFIRNFSLFFSNKTWIGKKNTSNLGRYVYLEKLVVFTRQFINLILGENVAQFDKSIGTIK